MQNDKRLVKMTRKDLNNNVLEVEHTDGTERWLVIKKTLHPKKVNLNAKSQKCFFSFEYILASVCVLFVVLILGL